MESILTTVFYQPAINILYLGSNIIDPSTFWLGIFFLVLIVKIALFPTHVSTIQMQQKIQGIQGKLQSLKERYKNDKEKLAFESMALYRKNNINPFKSILILLIQIPIVITIFLVTRDVSQGDTSYNLLYSFIGQPEPLSTTMFGFELAASSGGVLTISLATIIFSILSGTTLLILMRQSAKRVSGEQAKRIQKILQLVFTPLITISVFWFGAAVGFYFFINNVISIIQEMFIRERVGVVDEKTKKVSSETNNQITTNQ